MRLLDTVEVVPVSGLPALELGRLAAQQAGHGVRVVEVTRRHEVGADAVLVVVHVRRAPVAEDLAFPLALVAEHPCDRHRVGSERERPVDDLRVEVFPHETP